MDEETHLAPDVGNALCLALWGHRNGILDGHARNSAHAAVQQQA